MPQAKFRASKRPPYDWHKDHEWLPDANQKIIAKINRFPDNPNVLPALAYQKGHQKLTYVDSRDAIAAVLSVNLSHVEDASHRVGYPAENDEDGRFISYSMTQLSQRADLGEQRYRRARAAINAAYSDDAEHPFIAYYARAKQLESGAYIGFAWAKILQGKKFYKAIGCFNEMVKARVEAYERQKGSYSKALAAEGIVLTLDPGSVPLDARDVAQALGVSVASLMAPDTS